MNEMHIFVPLAKIDESRRLVYGVLVDETPDRSGEIFDYATSKGYFQAWSDAFAKATAALGVERSVGNLRAMHQAVSAGKFTTMTFNDDARRIEVVAEVVDDAEWAKVCKGVYTGFSIGGSYKNRWPDQATGKRRYTADPIEGSLVDLPCIPTATFEAHKATGEVELRKFAPESTDAADAATLTPADSGQADPASNVTEVATIFVAPTAPAVEEAMTKILAEIADLKARLTERETATPDAAPASEAGATQPLTPANAPAPADAGVAKADTVSAPSDGVVAEPSEAQQLHDLLVALGTHCPGPGPSWDPDRQPDNPLDFILTSAHRLVCGMGAVCPTTKAAEAEDVTKAGAAISAANLAHLRGIHDHVAALGACPHGKADPAPKADKTEKVSVPDPAPPAADEALHKQATDLAAALAELALVKTRLETLEQQPLPGGPALTREALRPVEKTLAGGDPAQADPQSTKALMDELVKYQHLAQVEPFPDRQEAIKAEVALIKIKLAQRGVQLDSPTA